LLRRRGAYPALQAGAFFTTQADGYGCFRRVPCLKVQP
jgi:hypothetical protein